MRRLNLVLAVLLALVIVKVSIDLWIGDGPDAGHLGSAPGWEYLELSNQTVTIDGAEHVVGVAIAEATFFELDGGIILSGRAFSPEGYAPRGELGPRPAMLTESWARFLSPGGDVLGMRFEMDGEEHVVVGVYADNEVWPTAVSVFVPHEADTGDAGGR